MSLVGKNRKIYSYNNKDRSGRNFMYKNFEKTNSYHSSFQKAVFAYASFRAAKMKYCCFRYASFIGAEFVGSNLRGSCFDNATFKNTIFSSTVLDNTSFINASFDNCFFVGTGVSSVKGITPPTTGISLLKSYPDPSAFSAELMQTVELLRDNDIIRHSNTLHLKGHRINTLGLLILKQYYSEDELIKFLPQIPRLLSKEFYTTSYLIKRLKKISASV